MKAKKNTELSEVQKQAVVLVAAGKPGNEIAQLLDVTPETISRWRQLPQFEAEVNRILLDAADAVKQKIRKLSLDAVGVIEHALTSESVPIRYRIDAAFKLLALLQPQSTFREIGSVDAKEIELDQQAQEQEKLLRGISLLSI